jgi:hypothetical protein
MMGETDGFKMAIELSKKETMKTKKETTTKGSDMHAMMSDTAGFQKILELSRREEEERQSKLKQI